MALVDEVTDPWQGDRLALVLSYAYRAFGQHGHVDANRVATALGVTPGTVRRWVRQGIPQKRRVAVAELMVPNSAALAQEERELAYAREALLDIVGRGAPLNPSWKKQGWVRPHLLVVVRLEKLGICVARITHAEGDQKSRERLRAGGGVVVEQEIFRNRFAAQVAKGELLEVVSPWRVVIPEGYLNRGRTEAWLLEAPRPTLTWLLEHPTVRIPVSRRRPKKKTAVAKA